MTINANDKPIKKNSLPGSDKSHAGYADRQARPGQITRADEEIAKRSLLRVDVG